MEHPAFSDDEVITSVMEGRTQNFEILIHRYGRRITLFINRMIGDPDEAQNLTQETFLKIYENLPYYKKENNFSAFIFKIARNLTLNWLHKQKRLVFFSRMVGRESRHPGFALKEIPGQRLVEQQIESRIVQGLLGLSEEQRLALILKVYLDFSYKQIAELTAWSIPKIETLISRAKGALKKHVLMQEKGSSAVYRARPK